MGLAMSGMKVKERILNRCSLAASEFRCKYGRVPKLVVVQVGNDPASESYIRSKVKAGNDAMIDVEVHHFDIQCTQEQIEESIDYLNRDTKVDAIIVQLPVPQFYDSSRLIACVDPSKDVDGLTAINQGYTLSGSSKGFRPCTPAGILEMLDEYNVKLKGASVAVIGRSLLVGRPMAAMLTSENATVTLCHSLTRNLDNITRSADIIVCAVGKRNFLTSDMVKPGVVLVDVGINRVGSHLYGDIAEDAHRKASLYSPVPCGVGLTTTAMLMDNTIKAAYEHEYKKQTSRNR